MQIHVTPIIQGITQGVAGAIVFWGFGILRDRSRNLLLRRDIRRQLKSVACGSGIHGLNASVVNHLQKTFTVREVVLVTNEAEYLFNATGVVETSVPEKPRKFTKEEKEKLKRGELVQGKMRMGHRSWRVNPTHSGFAEVLPFTSQEFVLPAELMPSIQGDPISLRTTVEYESWTKKVRILTQDNQGWTIDLLRKQVMSLREQIASGNFDKARAMWHLVPVSRQTDPPEPTDGSISTIASDPLPDSTSVNPPNASRGK